MDLERRGRVDWGGEEACVCVSSVGGGTGLLANTWELPLN